MERRDFLVTGLAATAGAAAFANAPAGDGPARPPLKGRIRQSVCAWCFGGMKLEDLCAMAKRCGIGAIDLLDEPQWATVRAAGLQCAIANGPGGIAKGWNRFEQHDALVRRSEELLPKVGAAGIPQMIVFSGNRDGMSDAEGLRNCAAGLRRIMPAAEKAGVTVVMELLNSKVDHRDYMCDRTAWGVELCKQVGSDRFRLLYDIYHMQVMEGDVIRTIRDNHPYFGHYHTAGNPGRNEIDGSQELNYRPICEAIVATGFKGFLAQEFIPRRDPMTSLREAIETCDV